ncbi:MAG: hypothetical protein E6Y23_01045 [Negativicoccus massiliensis]|nr:hypothetical protein [Negativicoccus succinicivorans]MDU4641329.1 hypothetical protein [Negativicoccus massiliensis]
MKKLAGNKKEAATWLKPAGEHRSAVTDTSIAASYTRSVEEMIQSVKPENQASPDETSE